MGEPHDNQVSALHLRTMGQDFVRLPDIPPTAVLDVLGHAVVLFAQLEYQLIVAYKRSTPGATLPAAIGERGGDTLGRLVKELLKLAEERNDKLKSITEQLKRIGELAQIRNQYVHIGFARRTHDQAWVFLKFGKETSEKAIIKELQDVSAEVATLIAQIQQKIPIE